MKSPACRRVGAALVAVLEALALASGCPSRSELDAASFDAPTPTDCAAGDATRGRLAVERRGCPSCHGADLGGATRGTPGANLTPHHLAAWTDAQLAAAILDGRAPSGAPLCTSMPRFRVHGMRGTECCDLIAHLRALPPIARDVADTCM